MIRTPNAVTTVKGTIAVTTGITTVKDTVAVTTDIATAKDTTADTVTAAITIRLKKIEKYIISRKRTRCFVKCSRRNETAAEKPKGNKRQKPRQ